MHFISKITVVQYIVYAFHVHVCILDFKQCIAVHRHPNPGKEVIVSETMSLTQFVDRYAKDLPLQIKVLRGYCGSTSRLTSKNS